MKHKAIADKIILLKKEDLALRDQLIREGKLGNGYNPQMQALHNHNATQLERIMEEIGYPTIEKVGKEASEAAWLVIQHAIGQPYFMKKSAQLLQKAVRDKKANPINFAYLSDRIAMYEGKPQLYGTQFDWDETGQLSPHPVDDYASVNQRRKALGLPTLEEQTKLIRQRAKDENETPLVDFEARKQQFEAWKKSVGWC